MPIILPSDSVYSKEDILPKAIEGAPMRAIVELVKKEGALFDIFTIHELRGITGQVMGAELEHRGINIPQLASAALETVPIGENPTDQEITAAIAKITASLAVIGSELSTAVKAILLDSSFRPIPEPSDEKMDEEN